MMTPEFIQAYTEANNRAIELMRKLQSKGILHEGVDDQLISDFYESQAEVKRFSDQLLAMNQQSS